MYFSTVWNDTFSHARFSHLQGKETYLVIVILFKTLPRILHPLNITTFIFRVLKTEVSCIKWHFAVVYQTYTTRLLFAQSTTIEHSDLPLVFIITNDDVCVRRVPFTERILATSHRWTVSFQSKLLSIVLIRKETDTLHERNLNLCRKIHFWNRFRG